MAQQAFDPHYANQGSHTDAAAHQDTPQTLVPQVSANTSQALTTVVEKPKPLLTEVMGNEVITIVAGAEKKHFTVHKKLITSSSEWMAEAFAKTPEPGSVFDLSDVLSSTFEVFVEYLYSRTLPFVSPNASREVQASELRRLCLLHSFGTSYGFDVGLQDSILEGIKAGFLVIDSFPEKKFVENVYKNTPHGSYLRKFCVDCMLYLLSQGGIKVKNVASFLSTNDDLMDDFLTIVSQQPCFEDPRTASCPSETAV